MNILESHIEGAQEFSPRDREKIYRAIIEYLYYGIDPDYLTGNCKGYFIAIKPSLDYNIAKREAGRKGGKQSGKQNASKQPSKTQANSQAKRKQNASDIDIDIDIEDLSNDKSKEVEEIISYLNIKAGRHFKPTKKTVGYIHARQSEGYSLQDFKTVIDNKIADWLNDPYWSKYLQPSTLFAPSHFDEYLNQTTKAKGDDRFAKYGD